MSKLLFSGVLFLLVALGSGASIQCQISLKDLHEAIIKKEQRAEKLARMIDDECIDALYSVDGHFRGLYYWNNWDASTDRSYTTTIINLALLYDQINVVEILIKRGANLWTKDNYGNTAMHIASYRGHKTVVIMIWNKLEPQAINQLNNGGATALHLAVYYRRADVIEELLKKFANPLITDNYGNTALHLAIDKARYFGAELIFMIIDAARQHTINNLGQNVMTDPSSFSSPNMIHGGRDRDIIRKAMLEFINLKNHRGKTALLIAITLDCSVEIVELLLGNGADPRIGDSNGNTALGLAIVYNRGVNMISAITTPARQQNVQNVMTGPSVWSSPNLGQHGRDRLMTSASMLEFINSRNPRGKSALNLAITNDCPVETVQCLLKNGADPRICDNQGNTALAVAIMYERSVNFISAMITAARQQIMHNLGQNVMTDPSSCSSPNLDHDGRDRDIIREAMLEFNNIKNHRGITALLIVIQNYCSVEIVELLLENGADPRIGDSNGNTALGLAIIYNRGVDIVSAIITPARQQNIQNVMTGPSVWSSPNLGQNGRDRVITRESMLEFINSRNPRGKSALYLAITNDCPVETIKILLEHDADPRIPDNNGETALDLAIQNERHDSITEIVNAVRNMPKLHFLQNGMTRPLYSGLIKHLIGHPLPIDVISVIFADDMINRWKKSAKNALVWAESAKRDDLANSLKIICDITETGTPIDASKQLPIVIKDCKANLIN